MNITNNLTKVFAGFVVALVAFGMVASSASAITAAELADAGFTDAQAALVLSLLGGSSSAATTGTASYTHTVTLRSGMNGAQVMELQKALNMAQDPDIVVDGDFGGMTAAAVRQFQTASGLVPDGVVGAMTGSALANATMTSGGDAMMSDSSDDSMMDDDSSFDGNEEGSLEDLELLSKYTNEDVGEGEEDVVVFGIEVEADGADQMLERVNILVDAPTLSSEDDLEDYIEAMSIWLNGEKLDTIDVDDASYDRDQDEYTFRFTGLAGSDSIMEEGEVSEILLSVDGIGNLDTAVDGQGWTIQLDSNGIRAASPNGEDDTFSTTELTTGTSFTVETFAAASGAELKVALGDDDSINEGHAVEIDDQDERIIELLEFTLEAEGDSDIEVFEIPVLVTTAEAAGTDFDDPDDIIDELILELDGQEIGSENLLTTDANDDVETVMFDNIDFTIDAGDEVTLVVKAEVKGTNDATDDGDTVRAEITATERGNIDAEDEVGENLSSSDKTGTAIAEDIALYETGIFVEFVDEDTEITSPGDAQAPTNDIGEFKVVLNVTAFGSDIYLDEGAFQDSDGTYDPANGVSFDINDTVNGSVTSSVLDSSADQGPISNNYLIDEGKTEQFTLTAAVEASVGSAQQRLNINAIGWATTDAQGTDLYVFNLDEFETDSLFLRNN